MRKLALVTLLAAAGAIGSGLAVVSPAADAQPAAPPPPPGMGMGMGRPGGMAGPGMASPGMGGPGMMGRPHGGGWMRRMRQFALVYPASDRNLSGADVQKIAEAFLLINGNHTWKVADVKEDGDRVTFELTTADGGEIARFAMDRHTARPERLS